ncbi:MAG: hypothetical protein JW821_11410 [Deltaproteobacteria bacterium]|nr:hypothetical protein [Deltaproteobacteria bacterium]
MIPEEFEKQMRQVVEAIRKDPGRKSHILMVCVSNIYDAVKETLKKQGSIMPFYVIFTNPPVFGVPPVTDEVILRAREETAEAILSVEGFESERDIGDVVYHISLSAPALGVMGWVLKVRLGDQSVTFEREMPYLFDGREKVKSLGELLEEMD